MAQLENYLYILQEFLICFSKAKDIIYNYIASYIFFRSSKGWYKSVIVYEKYGTLNKLLTLKQNQQLLWLHKSQYGWLK